MLAIADAGGLGDALARMGVALLVMCLLAALVLVLLRRRGLGTAGSPPPSLRVVARLALEPRRNVYLLDAAGRFLLVGVGEGPMAVLAELTAEEARRIEVEGSAGGPMGLGAVLRRVVGG